VIFDRIDRLEPWGYLLGDDLPKTHQWKNINLPNYDFDNYTDTSSNENELNIVITKSDSDTTTTT
jgi:hypothetical protein